jgi:hypothetical protein
LNIKEIILKLQKKSFGFAKLKIIKILILLLEKRLGFEVIN